MSNRVFESTHPKLEAQKAAGTNRQDFEEHRAAIFFLFAWLVEMGLELVFGAYVVFLVFGSNAEGMGVVQNVKEDLGFVLIFMLASGYVATTGWFGVMRPRRRALGQSWVNLVLFWAHAGVFLVFVGTPVGRTAGVLVLGLGAVAFASLIGGSIRALAPKPKEQS